MVDRLQIDDDATAGQTAVSYTDEFVAAGVARLDALFGEGYAKANPAALAGYIAACAANLNALMTAAGAVPGPSLMDALGALGDFGTPEPAPPSPPKRRKAR